MERKQKRETEDNDLMSKIDEMFKIPESGANNQAEVDDRLQQLREENTWARHLMNETE